MTLFELVKVVLSELYEEGRQEYGSNLDEKISKQIAYLSSSYGDLGNADREPINYKDPATRFAYVYKYVAAHGDYLIQVLEELAAKGPIFTDKTIRVSCLGGGPGSDIIALLKFLAEHQAEPVTKIICYLLDREQAWADTWTEVDESLSTAVALHPNFQPLDVTNPESWEAQKKFLQADIFTASFFVSEVYSLDEAGVVSKFWKKVFESAKPGALFIYTDNGHSKFNDYFDALWKKAGWKCLLQADNVRKVPRISEQSSELKEFKGKFNHAPKLQGQISYRALRKP